MNNEKIKGIWIPTEILQDNRFDLSAKVILAIYKYYTIEGELHCCILTNEQLADMIGISIPTVQRAKRKLKELNLIKTNNGIKVWYKGYQNDTHNNQEQGHQNDTPPHQNDTPEGIKMTPLGYQNDTHNKERKKNKKRNNKDTYNLSTLADKSTTSDISTSKGEKTPLTIADKYGLEFSNLVHQYWIDNDSLPLCDYYRQHPTDDISTAIKKALNSSDLQGFENFKNSLNNTNIKGLNY
jgi:hypothetical protein